MSHPVNTTVIILWPNEMGLRIFVKKKQNIYVHCDKIWLYIDIYCLFKKKIHAFTPFIASLMLGFSLVSIKLFLVMIIGNTTKIM